MVLPDGDALGENVVSPLPYLTKAMGDGLHVCLPSKDATSTYVSLLFDDTLTFGAVELGTSATHALDAYDDLSVTPVWSDGTGQSMRTPIVRGMAYVSAIYEGLTPQLAFASAAITALDGDALPPAGATVKSARVELTLANGLNRSMLFANAEKVAQLKMEALPLSASTSIP